MGIRLNNNMGYGLDLNIFEDTKPDLSRLNYDILEDPDLFEEWKQDVLALKHIKDVECVSERMIFHDRMNPPTTLADLIVYDDEFGFEDKLLLQPSMSRKEFSRYGDLLDTYAMEAEAYKKGLEFVMEPSWIQLPGTLYPYTNLMRPNPENPLGIEVYWESCYLDKPEHANAIPFVPIHLMLLLKHLRLWPEERLIDSFMSLRPTIYRKWS